MIIREIENKKTWQDFLYSVREKTFLQSWDWGEFQKKMGNKVWRLGVYDKDDLILSSLVVKINARRGAFLFLPHGPVIKEGKESLKEEGFKVLLNGLKKISETEKPVFIRISPVWERNRNNKEIFEHFGFRRAPIHMHPEETWELDTKLSEKDLLMGMRKTTRYLIRKGEKDRQLEIFQSHEIKDINVFNELYGRVVNRHHFIPFSLDYISKEFSLFDSGNHISVFLGKYKGEVVSSAIVVFWQGIAFYHHGASSLKYSKIPVSYLLQWEVIKEAKRRGCNSYNFWGIAPESSSKNHPWAGLTLFKKGFGGHGKKYVETQDLILSQRYWINWMIEKARKRKRGL